MRILISPKMGRTFIGLGLVQRNLTDRFWAFFPSLWSLRWDNKGCREWDYLWTETRQADFELLSVTDTQRIFLISTGRLSPRFWLAKILLWTKNFNFWICNLYIGTTYAYLLRDNDSSWKGMIPNDSVRGSDITV